MYQTLDAIDGWAGRIGIWMRADFDVSDRKQARRTGMQGPLGEMFDHGACCLFLHAPPFLMFAQDAMLLILL